MGHPIVTNGDFLLLEIPIAPSELRSIPRTARRLGHACRLQPGEPGVCLSILAASGAKNKFAPRCAGYVNRQFVKLQCMQ